MCNNRLKKHVRFHAISNCEDNKKHQEYQYIYLYKKAGSIKAILPAHIRHYSSIVPYLYPSGKKVSYVPLS